MKKALSVFVFVILNTVFIYGQKDYTKLVDPFIGTAGHGHTYPGASSPFGMVQLSPDTGTEGWDWSSGYHASDNSIIGFSHTHLSGTGVADYGDILFMPFTGKVKFDSGSKMNPDEGYRSRFTRNTEKASPGFYSVLLDDYNVEVNLTTTKRAGFHRYRFNDDQDANVLVDLDHGLQDATIESYINIIDETKIEGYRTSSGWANRHTVYFYAEFSKPIKEHLLNSDGNVIKEINAKGKSVKASFSFELDKNKEVLAKVGISHVSMEGAKKNLNEEVSHWDFNKVRNAAEENWNKLLSKIEVKGGTKDQQVTYYTSLYHAFLAPNLFSDVDQKYMGMDGKIKIAKDFNMYTIFSLWDTFRALHPLLTIIDEELTNDLIKSLIAKYEESGVLPVWELAANETWTMIGYHSIPVIVDAYMKGIRDFDVEKAYEAMVSSAMGKDRGIEYYRTMGFIPVDKAHDAVSSTLEYAYDDWCIAIMAKELGKDEDYNYFLSRAKNYLNVFDPETKFMRGRFNNGFWKSPFDPIEPSYLGSGEFTEGNSWQYTWFVPQDIKGLIDLMGGDKLFKEKLDELFTTEADKEKYQMPSDVTGLIGQYAQGNEPSHHVAYLYNYCGYPWMTQHYTRRIMDEMFNSTREGLCGNEDCGQMSAWYALSAIGFYPVLPGSNEYAIGSPLFDKAVIHLPNGKDFTIIAGNNNSNNKYIQSVKFDNKDFTKTYFTHDDILTGSTLELEMASEPNKNFGKSNKDRPNSEISKNVNPISYNKYFTPTINPYKSNFANNVEISIEQFLPESEIRFTLDGTEPTSESQLYTQPFVINRTIVVKAKVFGDELLLSNTAVKKYTKTIVRDNNDPFYVEDGILYPTILKNDKFHSTYSGGGKDGLIDGNIGTQDIRDGFWQGFEAEDCDIVIDLGKTSELKKISVNCLKGQGSWVFLPKQITVAFSNDGVNFTKPITVVENEVKENTKTEIIKYSKDLNKVKAKFIKFYAENVSVCPDFHKGAGGKAWLFIDEITIE